ncbi:hypothetical protein ACX0FC_16245, partial [Enterococcus faecium]
MAGALGQLRLDSPGLLCGAAAGYGFMAHSAYAVGDGVGQPHARHGNDGVGSAAHADAVASAMEDAEDD